MERAVSSAAPAAAGRGIGRGAPAGRAAAGRRRGRGPRRWRPRRRSRRAGARPARRPRRRRRPRVWWAVRVSRAPLRRRARRGTSAVLTKIAGRAQPLDQPVGDRGTPAPTQRIGASRRRGDRQPASSAQPVEQPDPVAQQLLAARRPRRTGAAGPRPGSAPSIGGCTGPEKIIGPPTCSTRPASPRRGTSARPPAAANDLFSEPATTVRASVAGARCSRAYPRPCRPVQETACASST